MEVDSDGKDTHLEVESDIFTITTHSVTDTNDKNNPLEVLNGKPVLFKIDTRVDVNVTSEAVFSQLQEVTLHPADHVNVTSEAVFNQLQGVTLHPADHVNVISEAVFNQLQGVTLHPADHVNVISEAVFSQLQEVTLHPADHYLIGPGE